MRNSQIKEVVGLPSRVFSGATVDTIILLTQKSPYSEKFNHSNVLVKVFGKKQVVAKIEHPKKEFYIKSKQWFEQNNFNIHADNSEIDLLKKMLNKRKTIADIADMHSGIKVYSVGRGTPVQTEAIRKSKPYTSDHWLGRTGVRFLMESILDDIRFYGIKTTGLNTVQTWLNPESRKTFWVKKS